MIEVTAGSRYMDIDAYASAIAYSKLLNSKGIKSIATNNGEYLNNSITKSLLDLSYKLDDKLDIKDKSIVLDVCNPTMISKEVLDSEIIEVIDHHPYYEYESFWKDRDTNFILDEIGSVCTIIFEKIKSENKLDILDTDLCKLLICGIIDNTLNLKADITSKRDIDAFNELMSISKLDISYVDEYLNECQSIIESNLEYSIDSDIKVDINEKDLPHIFGQLLINNIDSILNRKDEILKIMSSYNNDWILNIISLKDSKSYILSNNNEYLNKFTMFNGEFKEDMYILDKFMLRKEIIKAFKK